MNDTLQIKIFNCLIDFIIVPEKKLDNQHVT